MLGHRMELSCSDSCNNALASQSRMPSGQYHLSSVTSRFFGQSSCLNPLGCFPTQPGASTAHQGLELVRFPPFPKGFTRILRG
jgi:hypothetical protein